MNEPLVARIEAYFSTAEYGSLIKTTQLLREALAALKAKETSSEKWLREHAQEHREGDNAIEREDYRPECPNCYMEVDEEMEHRTALGKWRCEPPTRH